MAVSQAQRLRRAAQKATRRKAVVAEKRKTETAHAAGEEARQMAAATQGPIQRCLVSSDLQEEGIGWIALARSLPSGLLGAGFFLVDIWCLGVKDVFFATMPLSEFEERMERLVLAGASPLPIDPGHARGIIQGAVAYAAALGLSAAKGYAAVEKLFGDIEPKKGLVFGRNGVPHYLPGPHDSPSFVRRIDAAINKFLQARDSGAAADEGRLVHASEANGEAAASDDEGRA